MSDDRPSILDRWKKTAELPEREPEAERLAKEFTEKVMARIHFVLDPKNMEAVRFEADSARMTIAVNAAKWFLPAALRDFFSIEEKKRDLRALRKQVKDDREMGSAERTGKLRAIERRLAGLNQFDMGFDMLMSFGTHNAELQKDDQESLSKVGSTFASMLPLARDARRYLALHLWKEGAEGAKPVDALDEIGL